MMHMSSRTTITLDDDVLAKVKTEMRRTGASFKQAVNEMLRRADILASKSEAKPFKIKARDLGTYPGLNYDCVWRLLEKVEGPGYR